MSRKRAIKLLMDRGCDIYDYVDDRVILILW